MPQTHRITTGRKIFTESAKPLWVFSVVLAGLVVMPQITYAAPDITSGDSVGAVSVNQSASSISFGPICRAVHSVPVTVTEPFESYLKINDARTRALKRAGLLAINAIIGLNIQNKSESRLALEDDISKRTFVSTQSASTGGLIKYVLEHEQASGRTVNGKDINLLQLDLGVTVCIPKSKEELQKARELARPPRLVNSQNPVFFDAATGKPRLWYWRASTSEIELYDHAGFHPRSGDKLLPITRDIALAWQSAKTAHEQAQNAVDHATAQCDLLAANPDDKDKPHDVPGASFGVLRLNAKDAINACTRAHQARPYNPRYAYQLGRAWQTSNFARSQQFLQIAIKSDYAAAYDNIGWILLRKNRKGEARSVFARGISLGDTSSMFSLASLYEDAPDDWSQLQALNLYRRAARLGHQGAQRRLNQIAVEQNAAARQKEIDARRAKIEQQRQFERAQIKRQQDAAAAQLFLGVLGAVLQRQPRRY